MLTQEALEQHLKALGVGFERIDERTLGATFDGKTATFPFCIRRTNEWLFFTIVPFAPSPRSPKILLELFRRLLELNRDMNLAKFALDEDADVLLTVELPTENLTATQVRDGLDALRIYADAHHIEVSSFAAIEDERS